MINSMPKMLLLYFLLVYKLKKDKYIYIYIHRYSTDDINVTTFSRIYLNGRLSVALYFHLFFYSTGSHGSISWFYCNYLRTRYRVLLLLLFLLLFIL